MEIIRKNGKYVEAYVQASRTGTIVAVVTNNNGELSVCTKSMELNNYDVQAKEIMSFINTYNPSCIYIDDTGLSVGIADALEPLISAQNFADVLIERMGKIDKIHQIKVIESLGFKIQK